MAKIQSPKMYQLFILFLSTCTVGCIEKYLSSILISDTLTILYFLILSNLRNFAVVCLLGKTTFIYPLKLNIKYKRLPFGQVFPYLSRFLMANNFLPPKYRQDIFSIKKINLKIYFFNPTFESIQNTVQILSLSTGWTPPWT